MGLLNGQIVVVRYRLDEFYGNPPVQGGGVVIGRDFDEIIERLFDVYGDRIIYAEEEYLH